MYPKRISVLNFIRKAQSKKKKMESKFVEGPKLRPKQLKSYNYDKKCQKSKKKKKPTK